MNMYRYRTNNQDYPFLHMYQEVEVGDILQIIQSDISGFAFPVTFVVAEIQDGVLLLDFPKIKYGREPEE